MRIGINLWVWGAPISDEVIDRRVPQAAEMGFDALEIPFEEPGAFEYERTAARLSEHGLEGTIVAAMTENRDFLRDDPSVRENAREYVRESVRAADAIGAERVVGPLYSATGRTWKMNDDERERALGRLVPQLQELATFAAERDVTLCIEPLNRFETSFLNTTEQATTLVDRVDSEACKLLLDTFHMNIEERSIADAIRQCGDRIGHFHACGNDRGAPGNDTIDWEGVRDALHDVDYDGHVVIESFTPEVDSIARAAAIWRPLAETQDDLAREGLAFLQNNVLTATSPGG